MTDEQKRKQVEEISRLVRGELHTDEKVLKQFSIDGSIFQIMPAAVLQPKDTGDIQAVLSFLYAKASEGEPVLSVTTRGKGSDQAGGPLGDGLIIDTTKNLTHILEFGEDFVRVQPGVRYGELQKELKGRGRYLPPYPASLEICTIGGAVANNSSGEKTVKYGDTRDYVTEMKVVSASGDEVSLKSLDKTELAGKQHHYTFEGKIYREVEKLLQAHKREDELPKFKVTKNSTGYCIWEIEKRGRFDLVKLLVGSQGTLGIITEITLKTVPYPDNFILIAGYFDSIDKAAVATQELLALEPSALEIVDKNLLRLVDEQQPGHLKGLIPAKLPEIVLVIEFDNQDDRIRENKGKAALTILEKYASSYMQAHEPKKQERIWKLRRSAAAVIWTVTSEEKALPIVEDGVVPPQKLPEFFRRSYELFEKYNLKIAIWGHAGDANLHMQPFLNLSKKEDREKIWPFVDEFHALVMDMGGCISAEHNDGMLRSPYLKAQYGDELYAMFKTIKTIFDPYNFLNPGKKVDVEIEDIKKHLRTSYNLDHLVQDAEQINR